MRGVFAASGPNSLTFRPTFGPFCPKTGPVSPPAAPLAPSLAFRRLVSQNWTLAHTLYCVRRQDAAANLSTRQPIPTFHTTAAFHVTMTREYTLSVQTLHTPKSAAPGVASAESGAPPLPFRRPPCLFNSICGGPRGPSWPAAKIPP